MSYSFLDTLYIAALNLFYISSRRCAVVEKRVFNRCLFYRLSRFVYVLNPNPVTGMLDKCENVAHIVKLLKDIKLVLALEHCTVVRFCQPYW